MSNSIIVRVQSSEGTKRVKVSPSLSLSKFLQKVADELQIPRDGFNIYRCRNRTQEITSASRQTLHTLHIRNGDMFYLFPNAHGSSAMETEDEVSAFASSSSTGAAASNVVTPSSVAAIKVDEDDVDVLLAKQDGKIYRQRDLQFCHHNENSKCVHCVPLEPYDEKYMMMQDPPIKHMSFHTYLRKLKGGADKGKFVNLENLSCKIKTNCPTGHASWPDGICTNCQPSPVTLDRQVYRHVDNVMFENSKVIDNFLEYWRKTGFQRIGYMFGRYDIHKDVPLGIKAIVSTIYEPPQRATAHSIELLPDAKDKTIDSIAMKLGLRKVGWIFTDLIPEDLNKGTVKHTRNMDAHFLSAEECIMAASFQNQHCNPCNEATDRYFGSKFVTCIITGDVNNQIHQECYQVSNQCMALVRDGCLIPTKDAPELGYIRESTQDQYVPDVFYNEKDSYGNVLKKLARPLPVEFLLLDVPSGFSKDPIYAFNGRNAANHFPIENRSEFGEIQDLTALSKYMKQFPKSEFLQAMSDFHLLMYLATFEMFPLKEHMDLLLDALKLHDMKLAEEWSKGEHWSTLQHFMAAQAPSPTFSSGPIDISDEASSSSSAATWACNACTFINSGNRQACELCESSRP
ncbi:nuclear protein localization protein 4 homolog [Antedon mediterranea]|uniref:nuclear protein localization protein 4 homolog n=1 Tax=Antedon mediterranea TaxID=105859 RepID=UPI003AF77115